MCVKESFIKGFEVHLIGYAESVMCDVIKIRIYDATEYFMTSHIPFDNFNHIYPVLLMEGLN